MTDLPNYGYDAGDSLDEELQEFFKTRLFEVFSARPDIPPKKVLDAMFNIAVSHSSALEGPGNTATMLAVVAGGLAQLAKQEPKPSVN